MKKLLIGLLLMFSTTVNAGFLVDAWKTGDPLEVCTWAADQVGYAVNRRIANIPFVIKDKREIPPGIDYSVRVPKDALYVTSWDLLDQLDKDFLTRFIEFGYKLAERKLQAKPDAKFPQDFGQEYNKFMASCMTHKNNQEEIFRLVRTASNSEFMEGPACAATIQDVEIISDLVLNGFTIDSIKNHARKAPDISEERRANILEMLEDLEKSNSLEEWQARPHACAR